MNIDELLKELHKILDERKIYHWLEFGTLLGIYRDNHQLDNDIDLSIPLRYRTDVDCVCKIFENKGHTITKHFKRKGGLLYQMHKDGIGIDIYFCSFFRCLWYRFNFGTFRDYHYKGDYFWIPGKIEKYLEARYGEDWRTPKKGVCRKRNRFGW